ncbi:MAG: hypothetical protein ACD_51C00147G0002 [uncultured bacterium]|nr:MAG: hypothetical protein ACD_51C00147G0002 [uncultured bacterium]
MKKYIIATLVILICTFAGCSQNQAIGEQDVYSEKPEIGTGIEEIETPNINLFE